jgi:hypothetical protein
VLKCSPGAVDILFYDIKRTTGPPAGSFGATRSPSSPAPTPSFAADHSRRNSGCSPPACP